VLCPYSCPIPPLLVAANYAIRAKSAGIFNHNVTRSHDLFGIQKVIFSLVLAGSMTTAALAQEPKIVGTYVNESGGTKVRLSECEAGICGTIVWMKNPVNDVNNPDASKHDRPVVGLQAVTLKSTGSGSYTGSLYDTESGKTYAGKAKFSEASVQLSGCVLGGLLCKSQTWRRE
jgi:uncharacterized protein (DUF2147 family)